MSKYEIPYFTACIQAFGRRFSMTRQQDEENELYVQSPAYLYEMMNDQLIQYNVEHQLL